MEYKHPRHRIHHQLGKVVNCSSLSPEQVLDHCNPFLHFLALDLYKILVFAGFHHHKWPSSPSKHSMMRNFH